MAPRAMQPRSRKASAKPAMSRAKTWSSSTTGSAAKTIACPRSWSTSSAVAWQLSPPLAILLRLRPKLRPRRSRSHLVSVETGSGIGWSLAWPVRAATRPASIFLPRRSWPSAWGFCANWCPRLSVLPCWSTRPIPRAPSASTSREIEAAFAAIALDRADALFVGPDGFFNARRVQFATLATHYRIPAAYATREVVETGGLMSYGTDLLDMYRQVGVYTGRILKGANPTDLPVVQSTKFEFVINLQTARVLGLEVPLHLQQLADEVIE